MPEAKPAAPEDRGPKTWTTLAVLDWTRAHFERVGVESPRLDAEVLLASALGSSRVMLYARFDQPLSHEERARFRVMVVRRSRGEPTAYILGEREFYGMALEVTRDVLIPRPDTETLVDLALAELKPRAAPQVADVGTGTGCIALAIAREVAAARVLALDASPAACEVARRNAARHHLEARVTVIESDLLHGLPAGPPELDLVCANLPYIPRGEISGLMRDVRDFEPHRALDGGEDGLDLVRALITQASGRLVPGGKILLEIGHGQAAAVRAHLLDAGYTEPRIHQDLARRDRVVEATWR